jgi:hypothetical protein
VPRRPPRGTDEIAPRAAASTTSSRRKLVVAIVAAGLFVGGFLLGRARPGARATLTVPVLPANVELAIDGSALLTTEPGRALPIAPGRHTLTLTVGKREPKDFEIAIERGDRVLVVPMPATRPRSKE